MAAAKLQKKISARSVGTLSYIEGSLTRLWDTELKGFCVQAYKTGRKVYVVGYSHGGRYRWYTIGKHGDPWTAETARDKARSILGKVADGIDPAKERSETRVEAKGDVLTVTQLIEFYLEKGPIDKPDKRASSWENDRKYLSTHVQILLGNTPVENLTPTLLSQFQNDVLTGKSAEVIKKRKNGTGRRLSGGRGAASHSIRCLSACLGWAARREIISDNPCNKIEKLQDGMRERYLTTAEVARLFDAIDDLVDEGEITQQSVDALLLILYSAARVGEILALRWAEVSFEKRLIILPPMRHKTGGVNKPKALPITKSMEEILNRRLLTVSENQHYVFPSSRSETGHQSTLRHAFKKIVERAKVQDFRIHDFRHAYASFAINAGESLKTIGANLGHRKASTTERYAHLLVETRRPVAEGVEAVYHDARSKSVKP